MCRRSERFPQLLNTGIRSYHLARPQLGWWLRSSNNNNNPGNVNTSGSFNNNNATNNNIGLRPASPWAP